MLEYLEDVRKIVVPHLPYERWRQRAMKPKLEYRPHTLQEDLKNIETIVAEGGCFICDWAVTERLVWNDYASKITVFSDVSEPGPNIGRIIAYNLVHELGHAATLKEHKDQEWVDACRDMGICVERYGGQISHIKAPMVFCSPSVWKAIQALPSYPRSDE